LSAHGVELADPETRRGGLVLPFRDPHGLPVALAETADAREFVPWERSAVPAQHQVRGLHSVRLWERDARLTGRFLTDVMGFTALGEQDGWHGFAAGDGGSGALVEVREAPAEARGQWGTGGVHHVAWRVADEEAELLVRERIAEARRRPTEVIDRFWFKSVYFLEPGGVLFELATDGPGFGVDEPMESLGERLVLPPWLETHRVEIESALPVLRLTAEETASD
jgi:glyoxalase family protein